jgi:hypothetical protein
MALHQLKTFYTSKKTITRVKREATEKIFPSYSFIKGLMTRIYKELKS